MICATLKDAKARLNNLVNRATGGEDVILMRGSKHVAAIIPITEDDLALIPRISDEKAHRLWERIDQELATGKAKSVTSLDEIVK